MVPGQRGRQVPAPRASPCHAAGTAAARRLQQPAARTAKANFYLPRRPAFRLLEVWSFFTAGMTEPLMTYGLLARHGMQKSQPGIPCERELLPQQNHVG